MEDVNKYDEKEATVVAEIIAHCMKVITGSSVDVDTILASDWAIITPYMWHVQSAWLNLHYMGDSGQHEMDEVADTHLTPI